LLLTDAKSIEPKEPTDISGWNRAYEKSKAVVDKTSPLFVGIRALPSFQSCAGEALNAIDLDISVLRNKRIVAALPSQGAATTTTIAPIVAAPVTATTTTIAATTTTTTTIAAATTTAPAGYWASPQARQLFQPRQDELVEACLQRQVDLLNSVFNDWSKLNKVMEGGEETVSRLTEHQIQRLVHKCLYLRIAYEKALFGMGSSAVSWLKCTESTLQTTEQFGLTTFSCPRTVANMNQDFRHLEFFHVAHGISKGLQGLELFQIFPEAQRMLLVWANKNLEILNSETAREYLLSEVIPHCRTICNKELAQHGYPPFEPKKFLKFVRLKTLDVTTAWQWLKQLGFTYAKNEKCYYTDGHEKAENVRYRVKFIKRYLEHELCTFRWVQLTEDEAVALEQLAKHPLKQGLGHISSTYVIMSL
jgi:hypothetical protein